MFQFNSCSIYEDQYPKKNLRIKNISWDNVDYWNHNLERDLLLNIQAINFIVVLRHLDWWKFMFSTYDVDKKGASKI